MNRRTRSPWAAAFALVLFAASSWAQPYLHPPAVETYATHDPAGITVLPNGRQLQPAGKHFPLARFPHGLAMSRDGRRLFVPSDGVGQILTQWQSGSPKIVELNLAEAPGKKKFHLNAGGADFSPDGTLLYWSSGETGHDLRLRYGLDAVAGRDSTQRRIAGKKFEDSYAADLKVSEDGRYLYCADVTNFRLAIVDTGQRRVVGSAPVGRYPYTLAVSGSRVFVANIGLFEYSAVPPPTDGKSDPRGLTRPAFGYPSKAARDGVTFEGRKIPGLGDDNGPQSFSVTGVDVSNPQAPQVRQPLEDGPAHPRSVRQRHHRGRQRSQFSGRERRQSVRLQREQRHDRAHRSGHRSDCWRSSGSCPRPWSRACAAWGRPAWRCRPMAPDSTSRRAESMRSAFWTPARCRCWDTSRPPGTRTALAISPDGRHLACISFKGFGNGPNAGKEIPKSDFLGMRGVISILDGPSDGELQKMTATRSRMQRNGGSRGRSGRDVFPDHPGDPGRASQEIKYVVFITKENHTYDTIFDRVPGARHDPRCCAGACIKPSRKTASPRWRMWA